MIIAAAQFRPRTGDIAYNAARMADLVTEAAGRGAGLVLFAELALTHYDLTAIAADPGTLSAAPDDPRLAPVRDACRAAGVAAVVNTPGRDVPGAAPGALSIASYVYGPDGALLTRYDKRHLYGPEEEVFVPGGSDGRFALGGIRFALATCYDTSFPEVAERAAADGCRVYLASSFHSAPQALERYPRIARKHGMRVLLANGTGTGSPGTAVGRSGAWAADGSASAAAGPGEGAAEVVCADVRDAITVMADPEVAAVPVEECGQELVDVRTAAPELLVDGAEDDGSGDFALLRTGVLRRLLAAQRALPDGLRLRFAEGYRPPSLQRHYFERHLGRLAAAHPEWDAVRCRSAASRFVSPPEIAPHSAGGAVDLTLADADGIPLDMGTPIDASPEESAGRCYTGAPDIPAAARAHRRVLGTALRAAGLVNYPTEWWHWSYGDRYWALMTGAGHALYGPVERVR